MKEELDKLVKICSELYSKKLFKKYIYFIQFPFYRNLELDTRISFDFPLTIFIGQNGCGKSSCLHALYGAPDGYTPYRFWFDTKVDPVNYYDKRRRRHSFWYTFKKGNGTREVIKARIRRKNDPNYWETSRPLAWAGMKTRKGSKDRDKPIRKNVVYLDFRSELSAFDKFFYFGSVKDRRSSNKQEFLRTKSASLNKLFNGDKKTIFSSTRKLNQPPEKISKKELEWISYILGREYKSGISIFHNLYRNEGYSVLFQTEYARYSEAVAGSGEMAVVRLVREVLNAEKESLILLDEPEVSLHPGAQERLKYFLLDQIKTQKHQIILTTHSPSLAKGLPKESIKVFYQNPKNGRFLVNENLTPEEAFFHIEFPIDNRKNIIVEDALAKEIISEVLKRMGDATYNLFNVKFNPGGETVLKKEFITVFCRDEKSQDFIFFDGDQKPNTPHLDWRDFTNSDLTTENLSQKIKDQTGEKIKFSVDGGKSGSNGKQQIELLKAYLDYYRSNVYYLPKQIPEDIIWSDKFAKVLIKNVIASNNDLMQTLRDISEISSSKQKFAFLTKVIQGENNSEAIFSIQRQFLQKWLNKKNKDFHIIQETISAIINHA